MVLLLIYRYQQKRSVVLLCTTTKNGAGREIQQQYSGTSRGECCRSTQNFFSYSRVTPWGGIDTNVPTKMYCCCVLLCTTNKSGGRATAGERCMCKQQIQQHSSIIVVARVGRSVAGVHTKKYLVYFYSRVTPWGGAATNVPTKMYCCVKLCTTNKSVAAGERRWASKKVIHIGSGTTSYV